MSVLENNVEKLMLLTSGLVDDGDFNKKILQLRKTLGIPEDGFSVESSIDAYKVWKNKENQKKLENDVTEIVKMNPDLTPDMVSMVYNHALFPDTIMGQVDGYRLWMDNVDGVKTCKFEFKNHMDPRSLKRAIKSIREMNEQMPHFKPFDDIKRDIEILRLSQKKGDQLTSRAPDLENDDEISDEYIVSAIMPEEEDTVENLEKNKAYIRKRRSLAEKRIEELFQITYKGRETK